MIELLTATFLLIVRKNFVHFVEGEVMRHTFIATIVVIGLMAPPPVLLLVRLLIGIPYSQRFGHFITPW